MQSIPSYKPSHIIERRAKAKKEKQAIRNEKIFFIVAGILWGLFCAYLLIVAIIKEEASIVLGS
jgi:hypothetical protein